MKKVQKTKSTQRITVGNKIINIRKWKGKDKKNFIKALKKTEIEENDVMQALVYDCIIEDVILSTEEFKYVLSRIRAFSLGEDIKIEFYCPECGAQYTKTFKLSEVIRPIFNDLKNNEIHVKDVRIKLGEIRNKEFYIKKIQEDEEFDFLLRIQKFNDNDSFDLGELVNLLDDLEIDVLSEILEIYENHRFKVDNINDVKCDCGESQKFEFDELPGFFPDSWFE